MLRVKRVVLGAVLVTSLFGTAGAVSGAAHASCGASNRGGSAGGYDTASTTFGNVTISAEQYGSFAGGPAYLCSDGAAGAEAASRGRLEIKVDGVTVCTTTEQRLSTDPFGFGAGVHNPPAGATCGANISFSGVTTPFTPDPGDAGGNAEGVQGGLRKANTAVTGSYFYGTTSGDVPGGTTGYYTRGVRAASEH